MISAALALVPSHCCVTLLRSCCCVDSVKRLDLQAQQSFFARAYRSFSKEQQGAFARKHQRSGQQRAVTKEWQISGTSIKQTQITRMGGSLCSSC